MLTSKPRILIADDDWDTREILSGCLGHYGYEPLVVPDGQSALALSATNSLDLALLDVRMPDLGGLGLAERLWQGQPGLPVILITAYPELEDGVESMHRGAFYYLAKPLRVGQVLALVDQALAERETQGHSQVSNEITLDATLLPGKERLNGALTQRETQVLRHIAAGRTNQEIAAQLTISVATVKRHISNIYKRLDVSNRAQAICKAQEWERPDPET